MDNTSISHAPLTSIKANLDRLFPGEPWQDWALETLSDELKLGFDELTRDKLNVLQVLEKDPTIFVDDMAFFLHATKVMNNDPADFEYLPMPTALELAYSISQFKNLVGATTTDLQGCENLVDCVSYLLTEEGFSDPLSPFDFIPKNRLTEGQSPLDTANKKRAIELYTTHMNSL
jgi:hypothetical protein